MEKPVLKAFVGETELCQILSTELPVEKTPSIQANGNQSFILEDSKGKRYQYDLNFEDGSWVHFSIRVMQNLACQCDCLVNDSPEFSGSDLRTGKARGIRFSPIYLPGCKGNPADLHGKSLFYRGLHYSGRVTPGHVSLSCLCDQCERSFRLQSFHAGFGNCGYFYSDSGKDTLIVDNSVPGCPPAVGKPDIEALAKLEASLPLANKDQTHFRYLNPLRCPHCGAAYIDFEKFPGQRENEYYGNYFYGEKPQWFGKEGSMIDDRGSKEKLEG